jgi:hypothetical protein
MYHDLSQPAFMFRVIVLLFASMLIGVTLGLRDKQVRSVVAFAKRAWRNATSAMAVWFQRIESSSPRTARVVSTFNGWSLENAYPWRHSANVFGKVARAFTLGVGLAGILMAYDLLILGKVYWHRAGRVNYADWHNQPLMLCAWIVTLWSVGFIALLLAYYAPGKANLEVRATEAR